MNVTHQKTIAVTKSLRDEEEINLSADVICPSENMVEIGTYVRLVSAGCSAELEAELSAGNAIPYLVHVSGDAVSDMSLWEKICARKDVTGVIVDSNTPLNRHAPTLARVYRKAIIRFDKNADRQLCQGAPLVISQLDGYDKRVVVIANASKYTCNLYRRRQQVHEHKIKEKRRLSLLPARTSDRQLIHVSAISSHTHSCKESGLLKADYTGLFKLEESSLLEGGTISCAGLSELIIEGYRNARGGEFNVHVCPFTEENQSLFREYIKAVLRASGEKAAPGQHVQPGQINIVVPRVTSVVSIRQIRHIIDQCKQELHTEGIEYDDNVCLGIAIDNHLIARQMERVAREADFIPIVADELLMSHARAQDTGEGRDDEAAPVSKILEDIINDPASIRYMVGVVDAVRRSGKNVSVIGELPLYYVPLLVGMGVERIGVPAHLIADIKVLIRRLAAEDCREYFGSILRMGSAQEIRRRQIEYARLVTESFVMEGASQSDEKTLQTLEKIRELRHVTGQCIRRLRGLATLEDCRSLIRELKGDAAEEDLAAIDTYEQGLFTAFDLLVKQVLGVSNVDILQITQDPVRNGSGRQAMWVKQINRYISDLERTGYFVKGVSATELEVPLVYPTQEGDVVRELTTCEVKLDSHQRMYVEVPGNGDRKRRLYISGLEDCSVRLQQDTLLSRLFQDFCNRKGGVDLPGYTIKAIDGSKVAIYLNTIEPEETFCPLIDASNIEKLQELRELLYGRATSVSADADTTEVAALKRSSEELYRRIVNFVFGERLFINLLQERDQVSGLSTRLLLLTAGNNYIDQFISAVRDDVKITFSGDNTCRIGNRNVERMDADIDYLHAQIEEVFRLRDIGNWFLADHRAKQKEKLIGRLERDFGTTFHDAVMGKVQPLFVSPGEEVAMHILYLPIKVSGNGYKTQVTFVFNRPLSGEESDIFRPVFVVDLTTGRSFAYSEQDSGMEIRMDKSRQILEVTVDSDVFGKGSDLMVKPSRGVGQELFFEGDNEEKLTVQNIPSAIVSTNGIVTIDSAEAVIAQFMNKFYRDKSFDDEKLDSLKRRYTPRRMLEIVLGKLMAPTLVLNYSPVFVKMLNSLIESPKEAGVAMKIIKQRLEQIETGQRDKGVATERDRQLKKVCQMLLKVIPHMHITNHQDGILN